VTKQITSGLFEFLNRALGLSGEGAQTTELDDGFVSQVLEIQRIAAYSQAIGSRQGMVTTSLINNHVAAGDIIELFNPYNPGTRVEAFAAINPAEFDFWYLGCGVDVASSDQTIDEAAVMLDTTGMNRLNEGLTADVEQLLARFSGTASVELGHGAFLPEFGSLRAFVPPPFPFLWPRDQNLVAASQVTGVGATVLHFTIMWAMVNRGLRPSVI